MSQEQHPTINSISRNQIRGLAEEASNQLSYLRPADCPPNQKSQLEQAQNQVQNIRNYPDDREDVHQLAKTILNLIETLDLNEDNATWRDAALEPLQQIVQNTQPPAAVEPNVN